MTGNDVLFGDSENDDLIGGWGNDWISGGTGQDGVLGDDGRIFTSRNGLTEPLNGVVVANAPEFISTPGDVQQATINIADALKKSVDLTPYNPDPAQDEFFDPIAADDIIFGGLGDDFLHGGSGDDAMSGAEALPEHYANPFNPGNVLRYNEASGEFAEYDEVDPRSRIFYRDSPYYADGTEFLLNFDQTEGMDVSSGTYGTVQSDGDDVMFGDLGNDWLVGGTGRDNLYGGWGNDLLNADDDPTTNNGLNDTTDTHPSYEDRAFGGAGRDRLIANTGGDRLIDWAGEFNSYIVPFAPFGRGTVSRALQPQISEFLYALSKSDGADQTFAAPDDPRNGEPFGELGLVRQQDSAWRDQTGAPDDPQPGNVSGGTRDVLRSAGFDDAQEVTDTDFFADSGDWSVSNGRLAGSSARLGGDAAAVWFIGDSLPSYFEVHATISIDKPVGGSKTNACLIFDYVSSTDFKFAGLNASTNKIEMGRRTTEGWIVDEQTPMQVKSGADYDLLLTINGSSATLVVNGSTELSHVFASRTVDTSTLGLNWGLIGIGSDNSSGTFDNLAVQVLPAQINLSQTDNLTTRVSTISGTGNQLVQREDSDEPLI